MRFGRQGKADDMQPAPTKWQGWLDSNQRVRESKSLALPLGYTPVCKIGGRSFLKWEGPERTLRLFRLEVYGVGKGTRTLGPRNHNPML